MTEQLQHGTDVVDLLEQVGGERVTEGTACGTAPRTRECTKTRPPTPPYWASVAVFAEATRIAKPPARRV